MRRGHTGEPAGLWRASPWTLHPRPARGDLTSVGRAGDVFKASGEAAVVPSPGDGRSVQGVVRFQTRLEPDLILHHLDDIMT